MCIFKKLLFSSLLVLAFIALSVWAHAISCVSLLSGGLKNSEIIRVLRKLPREGQINDQDQVSAAGQFTGRMELLRTARSKLSNQDYEAFLEFYFSHFFFDRRLFVQDKLSTQINFIKPPEIYNENGEFPFDGYLKAREFIFSLKLDDLSIDTIRKTHRYLLSADSIKSEHRNQRRFFFLRYPPRNSENIPYEALGRIRFVKKGYFNRSDSPSNSDIKLSDGTVLFSGTRSYKDIFKETPYLSRSTFSSFVEYTPLSNWRFFEQILSFDLKQKLLDLEANRIVLDTNAFSIQSVRFTYLTELLSYSIKSLKKAVAGAKTKGDILDAVAHFYQEFVSIHPFYNGNGRVGRLLVERLLEEFDLPPPLWTAFGEDVVLKSDDFLRLFQDSIKLSSQFHIDMKVLVESGVDYHYAPTALLSKDIVGGANTSRGNLIPEEFMTWLNFRYEKTTLSVEEAINRFNEWKDNLNYYDDVNLGIRFATPLFVATFGLSSNQRDFLFKMKTFYSKDVVYRGISLSRVPPTEELLEHFVKTKGSMIGMGVDEASFKQQSLRIFDSYNHDLANDPKKIEKRIYCHVQANKGYWDSKFVSFSRYPRVANWFKNGYLMSKEFKLKMQARFEIQIRDRNVGSVDVLKKTKSISNQGISNEKEVLYVAGIDPEAVTKVIVDDILVDPKENKRLWYIISRWQKLKNIKILRRRIIERLSFNTLRLTEYDVKGKTVKRVQYRLNTDGGFVVESETVNSYNREQSLTN